MDPSNEQDTHIFEWLFGMLVAAITGLAAIVWRASGANTRLIVVETRLSQLETRLTTHEAQRAHLGTSEALDAMRREVEQLRARHVDDLIAVHGELAELRGGNHTS